jgi:translation initiation factor 1
MKKRDKKQSAKDQNTYELVYSTDPRPEKRCSDCNKSERECVCKQAPLPIGKNYCVRIEKKGRGGKVVTLVEKLPPHEATLDKICKFLKKRLGAGGTYYISDDMGVVEIQGERRSEILDLLSLEFSRS